MNTTTTGSRESTIETPNRIVDITDESGQLLPEVFEGIDYIVESDALLSPGHLVPADVLQLFAAAEEPQRKGCADA